MRRAWIWFLKHEGPVWALTLLWFVVVAVAIWWKAAPYDPSVRLGLEEWSFIGSLVSSIVAPVAILWVVRSFYVQKRELSAAVEAATQQASALAQQNNLTATNFLRAIRPDLRISVASSRIEPGSGAPTFFTRGPTEQYHIEIKNAGQGTAFDATVRLIAWSRDGEWEHQAWRKPVFAANEFANVSASRNQNAEERPTRFLVITVKCTDSDRSAWTDHYCFDPRTATLSKVDQELPAWLGNLADED